MNTIEKKNHAQLITVLAHTLMLLVSILALSFIAAIAESFPT